MDTLPIDVNACASSATPLLICEHCDTVYRRSPLKRGEITRCMRCGAVLERHQYFSIGTWLALTITAIILFMEVNLWPIVAFDFGGQEVQATLWGMMMQMWCQDAAIVAILIAMTLFFLPLWHLLGLSWLLFFAQRGRRAPWFQVLMVCLHHIRRWMMIEVFMLGVLVSIVKAYVYFDIRLDPGFFAYAALVLLMTLLLSLDLRQLWESPPPSSCDVGADG